MDVHEPYIPDSRYIECVDSSLKLSREQMLHLFKEVVLPRDASNKEIVELLKKLYLAHVCEIDEYAQHLFDILNKHKLLNDTCVIITTDHGEEFGEHSGLSHNGKMYSELVHVPQLVLNPPERKEEMCDLLVSGLDISPTIMYMFDQEPHDSFQGRSLFPLNEYHEEGVYGEAIGKLGHKIKETDRPAYFYRHENMKVIYGEEKDRWELYDLKNDPGEQNNIIHATSIAEKLKLKIKQRIHRQQI
jgi:arylsulfatase A-like enzyme